MKPEPHQSFIGGAAELADRAITLGKELGLSVDSVRVNERLVRYYVTEGVLDRPDRLGRDASYHYRHLLQLVTARRMVEAGMTLAVIARHNQGTASRALEKGLARPLPTPAEMLLMDFGNVGTRPLGQRAAPKASFAGGADPLGSNPNTQPPKAVALMDVVDELRRLRHDLVDRVRQIDRGIRQLADQQQHAQAALTELNDRLRQLESRIDTSTQHPIRRKA